MSVHTFALANISRKIDAQTKKDEINKTYKYQYQAGMTRYIKKFTFVDMSPSLFPRQENPPYRKPRTSSKSADNTHSNFVKLIRLKWDIHS